MTHKLPKLPYDYNALEPHFDARTMGIHHGKHHQAYVNNLNSALEAYPELQEKNVVELLTDLSEIPEAIRTTVRNNGGGHANHSMFWPCLSPKGGGTPKGKVAEGIDTTFGSFESFKGEFHKAAMTRFGSGWAWLCMDTSGKLLVTSTPNQDNPITDGQIPVLGLDVWEHAYYLMYQNRRGDYVDAFWNVVNWDQVSANLAAVKVASGIADAADWVGHTWASFEDAWKKHTGGSPE